MDFTDDIFNTHKCEIINNIKNSVSKSKEGLILLNSRLILESIFNPNDKIMCFIEYDLFNPYFVTFRYSDVRRVEVACTQYKFAKALNLNGFECLLDGDPSEIKIALDKARYFCENIDFRKLVNLILGCLKQNGLDYSEDFRHINYKIISISKTKSIKDFFKRMLR